MQLDTTISVQPTSTTTPYTHISQVTRDYFAGKPVIVRGYGPLSGLTIDCYEAAALRRMGYKRVELCLGTETEEVVL